MFKIFQNAIILSLFILCVSTPAEGYLYLIQGAEEEKKIPEKLLCAIACVESGRISEKDSKLRVWPWTINVHGRGYVFKTKNEAMTAIRGFQAKGYESIDVGIMQINLKHHPHAFQSLDEALDPARNIAYAAHLLHNLFLKYGSWHHAVRYYHSANPHFNHKYLQKVLNAWKKAKKMQSPSYQPNGSLRHLSWTASPHTLASVKKMPQPGTFQSTVTTTSDESIPITISFFPLKLGHGITHHKPEENIPENEKKIAHSSSGKEGVFPLEKPFKATPIMGKKINSLARSKTSVKKTLHPLPLGVMSVDVMPLF